MNNTKYKYIRINGKTIYEHRFVMEQHLGRKITKDEVIHHINGDRSDNRIENLVIITSGEHSTLHTKEKTARSTKNKGRMRRVNFNVGEADLKELEKLPGTLSEHLRQAVYDYLNKKQNASTSSSVVTFEEEGDYENKSSS